jgi:hypothetical protein
VLIYFLGTPDETTFPILHKSNNTPLPLRSNNQSPPLNWNVYPPTATPLLILILQESIDGDNGVAVGMGVYGSCDGDLLSLGIGCDSEDMFFSRN